MKKLLLASALTAIIAGNAAANENTFYLRADAGASMLPKQNLTLPKGKYAETINGRNYQLEREDAQKFKLKGQTHFIGSLGAGYYVLDNVRTELVFTSRFSAKYKATNINSGPDYDWSGITQNHNLKLTINSLMFKGLVDVYDTGMGKVFAGAGAGVTQLSGKLSESYSETYFGTKYTTTLSSKLKKQNLFSYLGTVGVGFNVSEGVILDLAYSYNGVDKYKAKGLKTNFSAHDLTAGVRVKL